MIIVWNIFLGNFRGITIFPFIILRDDRTKNNITVVNHEKIHLKQQLEIYLITALIMTTLILTGIMTSIGWAIALTLLSFYILYVGEWIVRLFMKGDAYRNISFEREAYDNEHNLEYLKNRKWYSHFKYFKKK